MAQDSTLWEAAYASFSRQATYYKIMGKNEKKRRKKAKKNLPKQKRPERVSSRPYIIYALELEHDCYYIGITRNVHARYVKHCNGQGSLWTATHKPRRILEVRRTTVFLESEAAKLEDQLTLEYADKYGRDKVRGGGYCQAKPRWPEKTLNKMNVDNINTQE